MLCVLNAMSGAPQGQMAVCGHSGSRGGLGQQPPLALVATMGAANTTVGTGWPQYLPLEVP